MHALDERIDTSTLAVGAAQLQGLLHDWLLRYEI
jgi:hypothetical protein